MTSTVTVVPAFGGAQFTPAPEAPEAEHDEMGDTIACSILSALGLGALGHLLEAAGKVEELQTHSPAAGGQFTQFRPAEALNPAKAFRA